MAGALDVARADRARHRSRLEQLRAGEKAARAKQGAGAPENKMLKGGPENKHQNPAKIAPSERPELKGVLFASAPARVQAENAGLRAIDFPADVLDRRVNTRDVRNAVEARGCE